MIATVLHFGVRLSSLRKESGLSMQQLAENAGLTRQTVHALETGQRKPSLETARRLAAAMGKSLAVFD
jgi:DNA-binding XRE family transcriptional regulator